MENGEWIIENACPPLAGNIEHLRLKIDLKFKIFAFIFATKHGPVA